MGGYDPKSSLLVITSETKVMFRVDVNFVVNTVGLGTNSPFVLY